MLNSRGAQIFAEQFLRAYTSSEPAQMEPEHFDPEQLAHAFAELGCFIDWREDRRAFTIHRGKRPLDS